MIQKSRTEFLCPLEVDGYLWRWDLRLGDYVSTFHQFYINLPGVRGACEFDVVDENLS